MTEKQAWLSRRYLLYRVFTNMWFFSAVWLYFYRIYITDQQVGAFDAVAFAIGLLAEVPSGALADKFGRDKTVRLGLVCTAAGILIQIIATNFTGFLIGQSVITIGFSLISGADDALFFEKLNFKRDSKDWRKLVTRGSQLGLMATLIAAVIGGWLHGIDPRLPWVFTAAGFVTSVFLIWPVKDTRLKSVRGKLAQEIKDYVHDIKTGFAQFRLPRLAPYVPIIITVQGLFYVAGYGILRIVLLSRFTFSPFWGAVAIAGCGLITVGILAIMHRRADSLREKQVLLTVSLAAATGLLLAIPNIGLWGFAVILALYAGEHILQPFMSEILNKHAPENQRATVLSVASFLRMIPYVLLAPLIGYLSTSGQLQYFLGAWALLIGGAVALYLISQRHDPRVKLRAG